MSLRPTRRQWLATLGGGSITVTGLATARSERRDRDRYVIGTATAQATREVEAAADALRHRYDFGRIGQAVSGWFSDRALEAFRARRDVRYVEPVEAVTMVDHAVEDGGDPTEEQVLPWGIDRIEAKLVHHDGHTASGASVSVIDTGIDPDHESLGENVAGGEAWVDCTGSCSVSWDDDNGHGTHVAGTAGAVDNDIGVVGTATEPSLYAAKVLDDRGSGTTDDVAAAIEWTADEGHDVANMSLGGDHSSVIEDACQYASEHGVLLVGAAGNEGEPDSVRYPAAYETVVAVSATDQDDQIAGFSSRGPEVELAAPGVDILSTALDDQYAEDSGTSMAAPHVAGAGAHLMAPDKGLSNEEARTTLTDTAADIGLEDTEQGAGLVDVEAAVATVTDEEEGDETLTVETHEPTDVTDTEMTIHGEALELGEAEEARAFFEGRYVWMDEFYPLQEEWIITEPQHFSEDAEEIENGSTVEYRAVLETDDDIDRGEVVTVTMDTTPTVDAIDLADNSNRRWARVNVEWSVSDGDGELDRVESTLRLADDDEVLDSDSSSVSGESASGDHSLRVRDGHDATYDVTVRVIDENGNSSAKTASITL